MEPAATTEEIVFHWTIFYDVTDTKILFHMLNKEIKFSRYEFYLLEYLIQPHQYFL